MHKQFEKILAAQFPNKAEFEKFVANSGESVSDLLLRVKLNLLSSKIQKKVSEKSKVSDAQIEKYYQENKSRFGTPEKRSVAIILTKNEAQAKKAKQEVESGKSFATVAKAVSIDPTSKANGGLLGEVVKGEEEKPLGEDIFAAPKGQLSGVVKTAFGYYIFQVRSVKPGTTQSLASSKSSIKTLLVTKDQQEALSKFIKEFKKHWLGKTDCSGEYVVTDCKQYKAPKKSASSVTTSE